MTFLSVNFVFISLFSRFFKISKEILKSPLSVRPSVRISPKSLDKIKPNLVCDLLT